MKKYTILSFNFCGYDKLREPVNPDPDAEYVYITDRPAESKVWHVRINRALSRLDPVMASYYVRWHALDFAKTDVVIVVDSSIQILDSLREVYEEFASSGADFGPMMSNFKDDEQKIHYWVNEFKRMPKEEGDRLLRFIGKIRKGGQRGSVCNACMVWRRTKESRRYMRHVWRYLMATGADGKPNRQDEVVSHKVLSLDCKRVKLFPMTIQLIHSSYMYYCVHNSDQRHPDRTDFDQDFWLCGCALNAARFSKTIPYPRQYRWRTEAVLLTKYLTRKDLYEWLDWHLDKAKFEHVHIFDNESRFDVARACARYGECVSVVKVYGDVRQYKLYDSYVNWQSAAEWVMPIDDDEFLDVGKFASVYDGIEYYRQKFGRMSVLAIRWKHLFPKSFKSTRKGSVLDYCTEESPELATLFNIVGDRGIKCIVRRYGSIHWQETWEAKGGGHVPLHTCFNGAMLPDGRCTKASLTPEEGPLEDERMRLLHCRYRGPKDWERKHMCNTVSDAVAHQKNVPFDNILWRLR